jgi:serine/threonine protein kinase
MSTTSLQVRNTDFSTPKHRAIEDARKMQAIVEEDCSKAGKDAPPYLLQELIGKGNYGRVYKATDVKTKALVAVKIINIEEGDTLNPKLADTYSEFMKEFSALKLLSESGAKNINLTLDALPVGQAMWMINEYCAGGSIATLMKPTAPGGLQEKWIIPIVREVAEAMYWVHKQGIIHRDIKCANVLVTEEGSVQLCDFGVAGIVESKVDKRTTFIGTLNWMAPELFEPVPSYSMPVDIWAFGCLIYELASGYPPNVMAGFNIHQLGQYIKHHAPRLEGDQYSDEIKDLIAFCLVEDPARRPTIQEIQQHPYIFGTGDMYPAASLVNLIKAYKLWEGQGNIRRSLFAPVGVQGPDDYTSAEPPSDEWNFSTTVDFDRQVMNTDAQAVFDVYGSNVDFEYNEQTSRPKPKPRRRPPPQLQPAKAPLEKVFDPNTISNYEENSREYYGKAPPPPMTTSDLPLRDDSLHSTLRESLIDLDMSLHDGGDLSQFVDMATIRAGMRAPGDSDNEEATDYNKPPLSDPADLNHNRRTQEWKFPTMAAPPASANPEMFRFPFHEESSESNGPPPLIHYPAEPVGFLSEPYDLAPQPPQDNRASVGSLIDLDEGLAMPELTRPSTANSDVASVTGSDIGGANPFDLERHASLYQPGQLGIREPSIYVSDDSDFARLAKATTDDAQPTIPDFTTNGSQSTSHSRSTSYDDDNYSATDYDSEYLSMGMSTPLSITDRRSRARTRARSQSGASVNSTTLQHPRVAAMNGSGMDNLEAGGGVAPPAAKVMQGAAGREQVRDEVMRLLAGFSEQLSATNAYISALPVRTGRRGSEAYGP